MVDPKVAIGHVEEHSDDQVHAHLELAFIVAQVFLLHDDIFVKYRLKVKGLEKVGVAGLVCEFEPAENTQDLFIVLYGLHVVAVLIELVRVLLVLVKVIEKAREGLLPELFQVVRVEKRVLDA